MSEAGQNIRSRKRRRTFSIKTFLPRSLFGRSLLILITPVLLLQVFATFMFFERHWTKMTMRLAYGVAGEVALIANAAEEWGDGEKLDDIVQLTGRHLSINAIFIADAKIEEPEKAEPVSPWKSEVRKKLNKELRSALHRPFILNIDFPEKWIEVAVQLDNGVLDVSFPVRRLFSSSGYIFLLWMIGGSVILLVIAIIFMRNQIRPIRKLAIAAERFGKGRTLESFRPSGAREVRQASQAFIDMHKRIRRQIEQRTAMLAGVSHDLRTPLTRMKLHLEMLGDTPDAKELKDDIQHMEKMIEGYIDFVRGEGDENVSYTNLAVLLKKAQETARAQGATVHMNVARDVNLMVQPLAFERCLTNLVTNAAKYAQNIWVSTQVKDEQIELYIEDDGPGIPEDQYEEVFRPFYRVDTSRNVETGGIGLGLPIAMDIVHAHGGQIWLEKSSHGGLKVSISLPV